MIATAKLKEAINFSGISRGQIASHLDISTHSLNRKIYNKAEFKASEIEALSDILAITDIKAIFFADSVDSKSTSLKIDRQDEKKKIKKSKYKLQIGKWFEHITLLIVAFLAFTIIGNQNTIMVMQTNIINMLDDMRIEQNERG